MSGLSFFVAAYAYSYQIYTDFSAYTGIANGSAGLFNIRLTQNFNGPYLADSEAEFWNPDPHIFQYHQILIPYANSAPLHF